jgi:hypothetical protein
MKFEKMLQDMELGGGAPVRKSVTLGKPGQDVLVNATRH